MLRKWVHAIAALAVAALLVAAANRAAAQDTAAGRQKALQCQGCHGLDGRAKIPGAPHIGGQVKEYLAKSMRDYKSGARKDEVMAVVVRQLSDQDIEDLAAYYAGLGAEAKDAQ
jgi:cytochrome c553